ncbi:beta-N-acetylhexosaminidase [Arthrobacter woluwensis]|uniref:beta-N-acetylhexosaminidase n=1 Tax=Arthrobacter woluwensis TaxID=156980 RepID=UPI0011A33C2A|nr:beta-N-acetylhexosaminidase [Arthrobacter woluwensis]
MRIPPLVPAPESLELLSGHLPVPARLAFATDLQTDDPGWALLRHQAEDWLGVRLGDADPEDALLLVSADPSLTPGAYRLDIDGLIRVEAADLDGVRHAWQTLRQLSEPEAFVPQGSARRRADGRTVHSLPRLRVADAPRFAHRGVLLDVARHFMPFSELLRFIDLLAAHKLNVLHLHLSDDQGWRFEVKAFPRLTEVASWRRDTPVAYDTPALEHALMAGHPHGGFYTQSQLREAVAYAAERGITIVPEIDLPGHSVAAIAAYPFLGVGSPDVEVSTRWGVSDCILDPSERTLDFYRTVLDELVSVFPSPTIHLGGDEVPYTRWEESPEIVARAQELGLASVASLHGWFLGRLADHLAGHGRQTGVWHEAIGEALPQSAIVNAWLGVDTVELSLERGHRTVISQHEFTYLDYRESDHPDEPSAFWPVLPLDKVHGFDPVPDRIAALERDHGGAVVGVQAQLWSEYLVDQRIRDFHAFPRLCAFSEVAWCTRKPGFEDFLSRLTGDPEIPGHLARLKAAGVGFRPLEGPEPWRARPDVARFRAEHAPAAPAAPGATAGE